jgi:hypothetical protein
MSEQEQNLYETAEARQCLALSEKLFEARKRCEALELENSRLEQLLSGFKQGDNQWAASEK